MCREHGVQYMDGVMFIPHPRLARFDGLLFEQRALGELRRVDSCFTSAGGDDFTARNIRVQAALEPLGCLAISALPGGSDDRPDHHEREAIEDNGRYHDSPPQYFQLDQPGLRAARLDSNGP